MNGKILTRGRCVALTHNLTQNRKNSGGVNGLYRAKNDMFLDTIRSESTGNVCFPALSAAHNPEVAGSSPAAATNVT